MERRVRSSTRLIVLHTTEAPARSSLNKVSDRGECHYCVTETGQIYAIVDRDREAFHAGRSMWQGAEDVDKYSIGIECVGYHDKAMSTVQLAERIVVLHGGRVVEQGTHAELFAAGGRYAALWELQARAYAR